MWHVSSRSGVATLRTAIHLLLTYLLTYLLLSAVLRPCAAALLLGARHGTQQQTRRTLPLRSNAMKQTDGRTYGRYTLFHRHRSAHYDQRGRSLVFRFGGLALPFLSVAPPGGKGGSFPPMGARPKIM